MITKPHLVRAALKRCLLDGWYVPAYSSESCDDHNVDWMAIPEEEFQWIVERWKRPEPPLQIFLSYAKEDRASALKIYTFLTSRRYRVWFDEKDTLPGSRWKLKIARAIRQADVVLVCLSTHSVTKSGYCQKEIRLALEMAEHKPEDQIYLIPLLFERCPVPDSLGDYQWLRWYEKGARLKLLESLINVVAPGGISQLPADPGRESHLNGRRHRRRV